MKQGVVKVRFALLLRSLLFTILLPGTMTVIIPYFIVAGRAGGLTSSWRALGLLPILVGGAALWRCIRDFAVLGGGTLAPVDPPKELVVEGLYRYVRNPMYEAVMLILAGEALLYWSGWLLVEALAMLAAAHFFIVFYEEPRLRRQFGESYDAYRNHVNRWWPRPSGRSTA